LNALAEFALERRVAIKVFEKEGGLISAGERFLREIQVAAKLQHPNILPVFDSGEGEALVYYVMPYVAGASLGPDPDPARAGRRPLGPGIRAPAPARPPARPPASACLHRPWTVHSPSRILGGPKEIPIPAEPTPVDSEAQTATGVSPMAALLAILLVLLLPVAEVSGQNPRLGPRDSVKLPPTDTGRVHVGMAAPDFTLETLRGPPITLSQFRGTRNVILVFYRGHW